MQINFSIKLKKIHGRVLVTFAGKILYLLLFKMVDGIIED